MADLPAWLGTATPITALVVVLIYLIRGVRDGAWVPRATVDLLTAMHEKRVQEKAEEAAAERLARTTQQEIAAEQAEQIAALVQGQETIVRIISALPRPDGGEGA